MGRVPGAVTRAEPSGSGLRRNPMRIVDLGRRAAVVTGLALCTGAGVTTYALVPPSPEPAAASAAMLPGFADCEGLRSWYVRSALRRVTAWGLEPPTYEGDVLFFRAAATPLAASARDAVGNGDTGTNLQEADVDEADVAKTDGERVVSIAGSDLVVTDVTGTAPVELGRLELPPRLRSGELLLQGDIAVVVGWTYLRTGHDTGRRWMPQPSRAARTLIARVDLSDPSEPMLTRLDRVEGELVSAREHEGIVRVVMTTAPELPFVTPGRGRGVREALAQNRQVIRNAAAQDWLPRRSTLGIRGKQPVFDCTDVTHPRRGSGPSTVSVLTFAAESTEVFAATGLAAEADVVYASAERLYVATHPDVDGFCCFDLDRRPGTRSQPPARTQLFAFDTANTQTSYVAAGSVRGSIDDRWSMSEQDGLLRVAAVRGPTWQPRQTVVSVLEESGGRLHVVGKVGGLGRREEIKAVRWFDDLAVLVTFRQVDPLYVLDLTDPRQPRISGELKLPGYSGYLHPLGGDLVLGIGQDGSSRGMLTGPQAATFDLTNRSVPTRVDATSLRDRGSSPVEEDARAFSYLPDSRIAFIPVAGWRVPGTPVVALRIEPDGALQRLGEPVVVPGGSATVRVLPLSGTRVAVVGNGQVVRVLDAGVAPTG